MDQLWALRVQSDNTYAVPEGVKKALLEAADDLQQATESLKASRAGVSKAEGSMIGQLEQSMTGMRDLAWGDHSDPNGYDIDMVQQRYALALTYAITWGETVLSRPSTKYNLILLSSILLVNVFSCGKGVRGPLQERSWPS